MVVCICMLSARNTGLRKRFPFRGYLQISHGLTPRQKFSSNAFFVPEPLTPNLQWSHQIFWPSHQLLKCSLITAHVDFSHTYLFHPISPKKYCTWRLVPVEYTFSCQFISLGSISSSLPFHFTSLHPNPSHLADGSCRTACRLALC